MRRSTLVFLFFGLIFAGLLGANYFVSTQPPTTLRLAVDPLAEAWVRQAVQAFNAQSPTLSNSTRVQIELLRQNEGDVISGRANWTTANRPAGWIAPSSLVSQRLPQTLPLRPLADSLAQTVLVWGGWGDYVSAITQDGAQPFDWAAVQAAAQAETWEGFGAAGLRGNVFIAIPPTSSSGGYGALLTAVAAQQNAADISRGSATSSAFAAWFEPLSLALSPSATAISTMATQGATRINFALLTEAEWLASLSSFGPRLNFGYPAYNVVLDFPLYLWDDASTTATEREGLRAFADFLRQAAQQSQAAAYGLRPASGTPTADAALFSQGAPYGLLRELPPSTFLSAPDRATADIIARLLE